MKKVLEIILGMVLLVIAILAAVFNWIPGLGQATLYVMGGLIVVIIAFFGIMLIILGINDLRE